MISIIYCGFSLQLYITINHRDYKGYWRTTYNLFVLFDLAINLLGCHARTLILFSSLMKPLNVNLLEGE